MKFNIEKFAKLARIKLSKKEEERIGKELSDVLDYFEELEELNTDKAPLVIGGASLVNVFREDEIPQERLNPSTESFPEKEKGYLKVPKVFSAEGGSAPGGEVKDD